MTGRRSRILLVAGTGMLLLLAIAANRLGWPVAVRIPIWLAALGGMVWTGLSKGQFSARDDSAKAAQPGLYDGSKFDGSTGGGGADG